MAPCSPSPFILANAYSSLSIMPPPNLSPTGRHDGRRPSIPVRLVSLLPPAKQRRHQLRPTPERLARILLWRRAGRAIARRELVLSPTLTSGLHAQPDGSRCAAAGHSTDSIYGGQQRHRCGDAWGRGEDGSFDCRASGRSQPGCCYRIDDCGGWWWLWCRFGRSVDCCGEHGGVGTRGGPRGCSGRGGWGRRRGCAEE